MRPFLDHSADDFEESGHTPHSVWPTYSRRRHPQDEWDDYIFLYSDREDLREQGIPEVEPEVYICSICHHNSPTMRGLTVHLSRKHGIKSKRADYYAGRNSS